MKRALWKEIIGRRLGYSRRCAIPNAWPFGGAARRGKVRLCLAGAHGADPVRAILPHEGAVRVRLGGEPSGGQVDPLPAEQDGQGLRGEAAAGADYAGYRTGDTA